MSVLGNLWCSIKTAFNSTPAGAVVTPCPPRALTPAEAQAWFDKFKARTDIPWNYPDDCCYTRAHVMAQALEAGGVTRGKAWNYATSASGPLHVGTPNSPAGFVEWGYHVAPTVPVLGANGTVSLMVLDPSIASGPITPQAWAALQGRAGSALVLTDAAPYYRNVAGRVASTPDAAKVNSTFDDHRAARAANFPPP